MPTKSFLRLKDDFSDVVFNSVSEVLLPHCEDIASEFYRQMSAHESGKQFLSSDLIEQRLKTSFTQWLAMLFVGKDDLDLDQLLRTHQLIGEIHARIGIPMALVDLGVQVVKDFCFRQFLAFNASSQLNADGIVFINNLFDTSISLINQSYFSQVVENERNAQAMRLTLAANDVVLECEKAKSDMLFWMNEFIANLVHPKRGELTYNKISDSGFGLWLKHKAPLYFPEYEELNKLDQILDEVDIKMTDTLGIQENQHLIIDYLDVKLKKMRWLLEEITQKQTIEKTARDPLTKLLNRRYIDTILKREVTLYNQTKSPFGVMMIDIDDFKAVNDTYGHGGGDEVLRQVCSCILESVRTSDFCFRYGGEEILALINNAELKIVLAKAENVRKSVESLHIDYHGELISVKVSIGVAMYDAHPDYQHTIEHADDALYIAKRNGKNQVRVHGSND